MLSTHPMVYIIDDDEDIRSSLTRSLGKRGFEVTAFPSAEAFLEVHRETQAGCIILDYGMPGLNGLELQEKLNAAGFTTPIIFITGHGGVPESVRAMRAGALDFLEKPFRTEVLVERINRAVQLSVAAQALRDKTLDAQRRLRVLTSREREIVDLIVSNPANTTSKEIGRALSISPRTVDHHRARILEKMQIKSIVELIEVALNAKPPTA